MKIPKDHENEEERLQLLKSYSVLDSLPEKDYDNLTKLAAEICGTPVSLITLLDDKRQWFKSNHGLKARQTPKAQAFCAHAIISETDFFIVEDARKDNRFFDNPLVTDDPNVIFYAGATLKDSSGLPLGTLCVIDHKPKVLEQKQLDALRILADQVMRLLELRKSKMHLEIVNKELENRNGELEKFAYVAAHDLKSPLNNISALTTMLLHDYGTKIDRKGVKIIQIIEHSAKTLKNLIEGILEYSKAPDEITAVKEEVNLKELTNNMTNLFAGETKCQIRIASKLENIYANKSAIERVILNLCTNAVKYGDKELTRIELGVDETEGFYNISMIDNGPGIPVEEQKKVFQLFETLSAKDRFGKKGNGIGLATVKKTIESLGGKVTIDSKMASGTKFIMSIPK